MLKNTKLYKYGGLNTIMENNKPSRTVAVRAYRYNELDDAKDAVKARLVEESRDFMSDDFTYEVFDALQELIPDLARSEIEWEAGSRYAHVSVLSSAVARHLEEEDGEAMEWLPRTVGYGFTAHLGGGMMCSGGTEPDSEHFNDEDYKFINSVVSKCEELFVRAETVVNWWPSEDEADAGADGMLFDASGDFLALEEDY
jgi:hypothetical protein